MTRRIVVLPLELANQIAAGEVVGRPASVVKELVENSIDAGATEIRIELEEGGVRRIAVIDNGTGIVKEDLPLALAPHATSKVYSLDELEALNTLGFRGEALASIASVSRLTLTSRHLSSPHAWVLEAEGSYLDPVLKPAALSLGTQVCVEDLFFNTPARRKFLKTEKTELAVIEESVKQQALSHFEIGFTLIHEGRVLLQLPKAESQEGQESRIRALLGEGFLEHAIWLDEASVDLHLSGFVGLPTFSRSQADHQFFFVNHRIVKDKLIAHAVRQAYQDVLYQGRHPVFVLYLGVDPAGVDVNVHPTKHEVRFREGRLVHDFIFSRLHKALAGVRPMPIASTGSVDPSFPNPPPPSKGRETGFPQETEQPVQQTFTLPIPEWVDPTPIQMRTQPSIPASPKTHEVGVLGMALAQIHGIYILAQNTTGLVLVDIHAAHERITYERLKQAWVHDKLISQPLLIPLTLPMTARQAAIVESEAETLRGLGFEVSLLNPSMLRMDAIPAVLKSSEIEGLLTGILEDLESLGSSVQLDRQVDQLLGSLACRSAVRAHQHLTLPELNQILRDLEQVDRAGQCVHGRPVYCQMSLASLDALFLRGR